MTVAIFVAIVIRPYAAGRFICIASDRSDFAALAAVKGVVFTVGSHECRLAAVDILKRALARLFAQWVHLGNVELQTGTLKRADLRVVWRRDKLVAGRAIDDFACALRQVLERWAQSRVSLPARFDHIKDQLRHSHGASKAVASLNVRCCLLLRHCELRSCREK